MQSLLEFGDELGPAKITHVHEPGIGLHGVLVVDNVAAGPSIGGLRMSPDVTTDECFRLARAMTLKNAMARLPHGGGKSVIRADPRMPLSEKEQHIRGFAYALRNEADYIFGPDMGTDERCMAWVKDEIGRACGLPAKLGGLPLDELGATAWGLRHAAEIAAEHCGFALDGARVVVQGFGAVGMNAARFLAELGAVLVGVADSGGTVADTEGLDVEALAALKREGKSVTAYAGGEKADREAVIGLACDIWIPAARPDVVNESNVDQLQAKLILQGANIPITPGAEDVLHQRGVLSLPDFIANAGGVICAAMEYQGATQTATFQTIEEKLRTNTRAVLDRMAATGESPRAAGLALATERVRRAMDGRRWSIF